MCKSSIQLRLFDKMTLPFQRLRFPLVLVPECVIVRDCGADCVAEGGRVLHRLHVGVELSGSRRGRGRSLG